ncbi:hypothetical protein A2V68_02150 [candidate division Kazan bacterium RBG_13_50_9]|uniref:Uncharacterized protein n=1 Tax=candidate division Kazan bacterium RBG_13_50_9 TaxID=1798535 RepID=A0A1F4NRL4_UNCK3|nr:MAG: hypothetical protein A2V68_02150 [candidate division Kazan bacterium RBG_13_50_9]
MNLLMSILGYALVCLFCLFQIWEIWRTRQSVGLNIAALWALTGGLFLLGASVIRSGGRPVLVASSALAVTLSILVLTLSYLYLGSDDNMVRDNTRRFFAWLTIVVLWLGTTVGLGKLLWGALLTSQQYTPGFTWFVISFGVLALLSLTLFWALLLYGDKIEEAIKQQAWRSQERARFRSEERRSRVFRRLFRF